MADWSEYEERAAILQYDAAMPRATAEAKARAQLEERERRRREPPQLGLGLALDVGRRLGGT